MPIPARVLSLGSRVPFFQSNAIDDRHKILTPEYAWDPDAETWRPLLVMFICSHSPYVQRIQTQLSAMVTEYQQRGLAAIAFSPNDPFSYPSDDEHHLRKQRDKFKFTFPYVLDGDQSVARAFEASCTPEFFLYRRMGDGGRLEYHGEYDSTRPGGIVTGAPLRRAIESVLRGEGVREDQQPSFGCSVKWKSGLDASAALVVS